MNPRSSAEALREPSSPHSAPRFAVFFFPAMMDRVPNKGSGRMHLYQWYIVVSAILIVLEIFAAGFILLPIGLAGLCTAVVAYFRPELWLHAVFFICGSGLALLALGKFRDQMNQKSPDLGVGPVGQTGIVVALPEAGRSFQIKVFGDIWEVVDNSLSSLQAAEIKLGANVKVTSVVGNKITIQKI